ncbi:hypothetical protein I5I01_gp52 [Mycobacterium phage MooMoo]|uniref:DUF732 domain-containing protein n=1 Tax=Mycobacterium phage MooMoo TaxID=2108127 RepID=A0A2P1JR87_9CAUD|nr:hypothetical protein I5I01_gp52 [Mycobacterium phage MooMoo]AVO21657.1 hypothetical protein SEA_MOOMOO_52 [Mycobacterium phage MooMoo]
MLNRSLRQSTVHKRTARRILGTMSAVSVVAVTGILHAGHADATPSQDRAFISVIDSFGLSYPSTSYAVREAHRVCAVLDTGVTPVGLAVAIADPPRLSVIDAGHFVGAAIGVYCDWHMVGVAA